ncbi:hypothetical protein FACS1894189_7130 [Planctomycetales bacterium]|nr:hypothetical protein FACS1894189_7130 [Planctomycetales bacterium]
MNETTEYENILPKELARWVHNNTDIEGITISGGEPFMQPVEELCEFLEVVRQNNNDKLSVVCYTGYLIDELLADRSKKTVLSYVDVLIDGQYAQEQDAGQRWRGSANQRFHFLTERYRSCADEWNTAMERQIELDLDINGKLLISGVPSKDFINKLTTALRQRDVNVDFS